MTPSILRQMRHRPARAATLGLGIMLAASSFTVLTGTARTSELKTTQAVQVNFRSAYDVLVRPRGSTTDLERQRGLVRQNFQSGIYGGISLGQYATVKRLAGVDVAAPVAMIGYVTPRVTVPVDVTPLLSGAPRQLFRVRRVWVSENGRTRVRDADSYVYVTRAPMAKPGPAGDTLDDVEVTPGGPRTVCRTAVNPRPGSGPFDQASRGGLACWSLVNGFGGLGQGFVPGFAPGHVGLAAYWSFPLTIAAIDPEQEARLTGLDAAVVRGRYLTASDAPGTTTAGFGAAQVPVLTPTRPYGEEHLEVAVERLPESIAETAVTAPLRLETAATRLNRVPAVGRGAERQVPQSTAYSALLSQLRGENGAFFDGLDGYWTGAPVEYDAPSPDALVPRAVTNANSVWSSSFFGTGWAVVPATVQDTQFRVLTHHQARETASDGGASSFPVLRSVGEFDPAKLAEFSRLTRVPLETYNAPAASPADSPSGKALGGRDLLPNGNIAGYLQAPPLVLTTLQGMRTFLDANVFAGVTAERPISVIRVRVAGVTGLDAASRERVRLVAQQITAKTGLDVDITVGSSPTPIRVDLPPGRFGRPPLRLQEGWVLKGVAVAILYAVDRKSVVLFGLVLIVCCLFVLNATTAAVRTRRLELAILASTGWTGRKLFRLIMTELTLVAAVSGVAGGLIALPVARLLGVEFPAERAAAAVPAAVLLAVLAGLAPALRAARSDPADAIRPPVASARRNGTPRTIPSMAARNLLRVPGRTLVGAACLAVGLASLTLLLAVSYAYRGAVVGSLLGNAVAVQARGADYAAAAMMVLLGAASIADVLYLNVRERAGELATLRVIGWREHHLMELVAVEGVGLGVLGAALGAATALVAIAIFAGGLGAAVLATAGLTAVAGVAVAAVAAVVPALLVRRLPTTEVLTET